VKPGWLQETKALKAVESLKNRGYEAYYHPSREPARAGILESIPLDATIGFGGSMTLMEIGVLEALEARGNVLITGINEPLGPERTESRRRAMLSDVFLTGINALTTDGLIVNLDNSGNRVASMVFGPKRVIMVTGVNKIVDSLEHAVARVRNHAAVMNAGRLERNTPCRATGRCIDCNSPERICRVLTIVERCPAATEVSVWIIGEALGF